MTSTERAPEGHSRMVWGKMLRHIREASGLSREELAARASLSVSTIVSYESGWRSLVRRTVEEQIEPALGPASNGVLLKLWDEFEDAMNYSVFPAGVVDLAGQEKEADSIRCYGFGLVPGLLQTEDYARALMAARLRITAEEIEQRVAERMKRQEILAREQPPLVLSIIDEAALHRPVGGRHGVPGAGYEGPGRAGAGVHRWAVGRFRRRGEVRPDGLIRAAAGHTSLGRNVAAGTTRILPNHGCGARG